jgi:hypothetical protein
MLEKGNISVLFLYDSTFDKTMWKRQLDNLKVSNRIMVVDIRKFSKSKDEEKPPSIDLFMEEFNK